MNASFSSMASIKQYLLHVAQKTLKRCEQYASGEK